MKQVLLALFAAAALALSSPAPAAKSAGDIVDDSTITASIKAALFDDKNTHALQINVETYKGIVQLSGFVASEAERNEATRVTKGVSGVKEVHNDVAIHDATSVGTKLDDSLITGRVKSALIDAADVKGRQINVETKGGIVQLAGFVTSDGMRARAEKIAVGIHGVKRVDNVLLVKPE